MDSVTLGHDYGVMERGVSRETHFLFIFEQTIYIFYIISIAFNLY